MLESILALRPTFGYNIFVAILFALVTNILIWQIFRTVTLLRGRRPMLFVRILRIFLSILVFVLGSLGVALLGGLTATTLYLAFIVASASGMLLTLKMAVSESKQKMIQELSESKSVLPNKAELFAAAVELKLEESDIHIGIFRHGLAPLGKRTALGKKSIRKLR